MGLIRMMRRVVIQNMKTLKTSFYVVNTIVMLVIVYRMSQSSQAVLSVRADNTREGIHERQHVGEEYATGLNDGNPTKGRSTGWKRANQAFTPPQNVQDSTTVISVTGGHTTTTPATNINETCKTRKGVVFVKVSRCGSTTLGNIFSRFAYRHSLSVAMVARENMTSSKQNRNVIRGEFAHPLINAKLVSKSSDAFSDTKYDLLFFDGLYDKTTRWLLSRSDSFFVASLRDPWEQFRSAFIYNDVHTQLGIRGTNALKLFLEDSNLANKIRCRSKRARSYLGYGPECLRNSMAHDLGFPVNSSLENNVTFINEFIRGMDHALDLVLILPDNVIEGLVLLKRSLCWTTEDILHLVINFGPRTENTLTNQTGNNAKPTQGLNHSVAPPLQDKVNKSITLTNMNMTSQVKANETGSMTSTNMNMTSHVKANENGSVTSKDTPKRMTKKESKKTGKTIAEEDIVGRMKSLHRNWSRVDYVLYEHFRDKFQKTLKSQDSYFFEEANHFKVLLNHLYEYCKTYSLASKYMVVLVQKWTKEFTVSPKHCVKMQMREEDFFKFS